MSESELPHLSREGVGARPAPRTELLALIAARRPDLDITTIGQTIANQHYLDRIPYDRIVVETVGMAFRGEDLRDLRTRLDQLAKIRARR